jgi:hypothetical protein
MDAGKMPVLQDAAYSFNTLNRHTVTCENFSPGRSSVDG